MEGFIELLLEQLLLSTSALAGLAGELLLLDRLLERDASLLHSKDPTSVWRGHLHDARDFRRGTLSIEVKTTTGHDRRHTIHSLDQIEPRRDANGEPMEQVHLLSIGLRPSPNGATSIPGLVGSLLARVAHAAHPATAAEQLLKRISQWGPSGMRGYYHDKDQSSTLFGQRFSISLEPQAYSLDDSNLRLLRSDDLQDTVVERQGMSYRVLLPDSVPRSPGNPRVGLNAVADLLRG